jgi:hypothetical protein
MLGMPKEFRFCLKSSGESNHVPEEESIGLLLLAADVNTFFKTVLGGKEGRLTHWLNTGVKILKL